MRYSGMVDYLIGVVVIILPFAVGLQGMQQWTLVSPSMLVIPYSAISDCEAGVVRFLRVRFDLLLDAPFGLVMLLTPSLLSFPANMRWPNYVIGVAALILGTTADVRASGTAANEKTISGEVS